MRSTAVARGQVGGAWSRCAVVWLLTGLSGVGCARTVYVRPTPNPPPQASTLPDAVSPGTLAGAQVKQQLSSESSKPGDRFTAELLDPLVDNSGRAVVERGAILQGVVQGTDTSRIAGDAAGLQLQILGVDQPGEGLVRLPLEVSASPVELESGVKREIFGTVAGMAAGAGAGIAIDKDRTGVVLGSALIGAGVGAVVAYLFGTRQATLPGGSVVTLRVTEPLVLENPVAGNTKCYPAAPKRSLARTTAAPAPKVTPVALEPHE